MSSGKIALFWILSFTWGIIMTIIGSIGAIVFLIGGARPERVGYSWAFVTGENWGAVTLDPFSWISKTSYKNQATKLHEAGHSIQNCIYGVPFPIIIGIPALITASMSSSKHWNMWYEKQATKSGEKYCNF